ELPGAALEFAGGVYHEMGHLPAIGPVFERAGKSFDDLAKVTDDAIGVNADDIKARNAIASGAGHVAGAIGVSGVGGEFAEAKRAYDAGSAVDKAASLVMEVKEGFDAAQEKWETVTGIFTEVAAGVVELGTDELAGDQDKWKHLIGHLDGVLDLAIEKLGKMEGAALGGDSAKEKKKKDDRIQKKHDAAVDKAGEDAMSQELKDAHAAAARSARLAKNPQGTPASRSRAAAQLKKDAAKVRELGDRDALAIASARAKADQEEDKTDDQARALDADMKKAADRAGYYKEQLADVVKEVIVGFTVGALKGAKEELVEALERLADGKAANLDGRQMLIKALTKGGTNAIIDVVEPRVKKKLVKFFENAIGDLLAHIDEELRGAATLAESAIEEAVDWGLEQIGAEEWLEEKIGWLVEQAFGGNESLVKDGSVSAE
ncbi:MAG TPA: hypothetical protein VL463_24920, partial [Kofleriaceae bacterium]|nr:hypothetical protein [Kofleriaceae bacterium]